MFYLLTLIKHRKYLGGRILFTTFNKTDPWSSKHVFYLCTTVLEFYSTNK